MTSTRQTRLGLALVSLCAFLLAFVVRLYWLKEVQSPLDSEYSDMAGYVNRAKGFLDDTYPGDKRLLAMFPPGTHLLVALEFKFLGRDARDAIAITHATIGAIPAAFVTALTFRLVPSLFAAAIVGVLIAFWFPQVAFTGFFSSEMWFTAAISIHAWLAVRPWRRPPGLMSIGVAAIAAVVIRSQFLLTWGLDMLARGLQHLWRRGLRKTFWNVMCLSLPVVVGLAITSMRFHRLTGYWALVNESAGNRLWADTDICRLEATWQTPDGATWTYWFTPPSKPSKGPGEEVKINGYVVDRDILAALTRERMRGVPLLRRVARRLWNISLLVAGNLPWPESNYHDSVAIVGTRIAFTRYAIGETFRDILHWVVLPLGAFGLLLGRRNRLLYLLAANVVTAVVAAAFFFGEARYHVPYDPFLLLLAVTGAYELLRRGRFLVRRLSGRLSFGLFRGRDEHGALAQEDRARDAPSSSTRVARRAFGLALVAAALGLAVNMLWSISPGSSCSETRADGPPTVAWHHGLHPKDVEAVVDNDSRLVQIQVQQTSPLLFNVAVAKNMGRDRRDWWWVPGTGPELTGSELGGFASRHEARVVSVAPYVREGTTYLAAVLIRNTGYDARGWWWFFDLPRGSVDGLVTEHDARPIDLRSYLKDGQTAYALILVGKQAPDERSWWYTGASRSAVKAELRKNAASLVSLQSAAGPGDQELDVIMDNQPPGATGLSGVSWVWSTDDGD